MTAIEPVSSGCQMLPLCQQSYFKHRQVIFYIFIFKKQQQTFFAFLNSLYLSLCLSFFLSRLLSVCLSIFSMHMSLPQRQMNEPGGGLGMKKKKKKEQKKEQKWRNQILTCASIVNAKQSFPCDLIDWKASVNILRENLTRDLSWVSSRVCRHLITMDQSLRYYKTIGLTYLPT